MKQYIKKSTFALVCGLFISTFSFTGAMAQNTAPECGEMERQLWGSAGDASDDIVGVECSGDQTVTIFNQAMDKTSLTHPVQPYPLPIIIIEVNEEGEEVEVEVAPLTEETTTCDGKVKPMLLGTSLNSLVNAVMMQQEQSIQAVSAYTIGTNTIQSGSTVAGFTDIVTIDAKIGSYDLRELRCKPVLRRVETSE